MIIMVTGADEPRTIKIMATIAADEVRAALAAYHLSGSTAQSHEIYFCEQPRQRRYVAECTTTYVDLDDLILLGPVTAQRWRLRVPRYDITAERWTVLHPGNPPGLDLLELSITAEPEDAALIQPAFLASIRH